VNTVVGCRRALTLLLLVFWLSSRTKRFLFNRFLAQSGLDSELIYQILPLHDGTVLAGTNSYTGFTRVTGGTLTVGSSGTLLDS
jgi:autotransporter-associated beta strand protein